MEYHLFPFLLNLFNYLSHCRDRFITVTNIVGDAMGTDIVEHLSRDELKTEREENNNPGNIHITEKFLEHDEPRAHLMITGV